MFNDPFVKSYDWINKAQNLTPTQKIIIHQILRYDDKKLKCIQSYPSMGETLGLCSSTVKKNISALRKTGIIQADINPFVGHKFWIDLSILKDFISDYKPIQKKDKKPVELNIENIQSEDVIQNTNDVSEIILESGMRYCSELVNFTYEYLISQNISMTKENVLLNYDKVLNLN